MYTCRCKSLCKSHEVRLRQPKESPSQQCTPIHVSNSCLYPHIPAKPWQGFFSPEWHIVHSILPAPLSEQATCAIISSILSTSMSLRFYNMRLESHIVVSNMTQARELKHYSLFLFSPTPPHPSSPLHDHVFIFIPLFTWFPDKVTVSASLPSLQTHSPLQSQGMEGVASDSPDLFLPWCFHVIGYRFTVGTSYSTTAYFLIGMCNFCLKLQTVIVFLKFLSGDIKPTFMHVWRGNIPFDLAFFL